jgi:hypothetical protein
MTSHQALRAPMGSRRSREKGGRAERALARMLDEASRRGPEDGARP